jgi:lipid II:glycine glycyltransferase (peptidoglycan interpeptide bridge formation enzyme)
LQTGVWGELKSAFGWKPVRIVHEKAGVQLLFRKLPLGFSIGYLPKANPHESLWREIDLVCKQNRAIFLKLEPDLWQDAPSANLPIYQFRISPHNIQPPRTIVVDIQSSEEEILARMKQKTRYNIRLAEKKGVTVRPWNDLMSFHKMMLVTGVRDGFGVH